MLQPLLYLRGSRVVFHVYGGSQVNNGCNELLWNVFLLVRSVQSGVKVSHKRFYLTPEYGLAPCFLVFPESLVLFRKQLIPSLADGFKLGVFTAGIYVYLSVVGVEIAVFRSVLAFRDAYIKTALFCVK